jgi:aminoglycoside 2'-N-acetyltransferase I
MTPTLTAGRREGRQVHPSPEQGFLGRVLCQSGIAAHTIDHMDDFLVVTPDEFSEGAAVTSYGNEMKIEIKADSQLNTQERVQLDLLFAKAFPPDGTDIEWSKSDWHVLVWEGDELASHVEIVERTATVDDQPVRLGGIGGVATKAEWRRRGLAEAAMKTAQAFLHDRLAVDFGLLVCGENMTPYYGKLGWKLVGHSMLIDQAKGKVTYMTPTMILPVCKDKWPDGEIDLCGPPW